MSIIRETTVVTRTAQSDPPCMSGMLAAERACETAIFALEAVNRFDLADRVRPVLADFKGSRA